MNSFKLKILVLISFLLLYGYSYQKFLRYKPNIVEQRDETKGESVVQNESINLPFPEKYTLISRNQKDYGEHITYETSQSPDAIQTFYRNILISKNWKIESTGKDTIFTTTRYKYEDSLVDVTTSLKQEGGQNLENNTIVSLFVKN